jgi:hypothetical protein
MRIVGFQRNNVIILSKRTPETNPNILLGPSTSQLYMNALKIGDKINISKILQPIKGGKYA